MSKQHDPEHQCLRPTNHPRILSTSPSDRNEIRSVFIVFHSIQKYSHQKYKSVEEKKPAQRQASSQRSLAPTMRQTVATWSPSATHLNAILSIPWRINYPLHRPKEESIFLILFYSAMMPWLMCTRSLGSSVVVLQLIDNVAHQSDWLTDWLVNPSRHPLCSLFDPQLPCVRW